MHYHISDTVVSFWGGFILTIGKIMLQVNFHEFMNMAPWKLLMTLAVGVMGGAAGIIGKELIYYIKKKFKRK